MPTLHYRSRKYHQLVEWIAVNDNPGDDEPVEAIAGYLTVVMLARVYNLKCVEVAKDVVSLREESVTKCA